jgi:hypothetical protein
MCFCLAEILEKMVHGFFFQLQENTARELKRELSKITKEFTSQVHSPEEKNSQLISEKVCETQDFYFCHV